LVEFIKINSYQTKKVTCLDANLPCKVELSFFAVSLNLFYCQGRSLRWR